MSICLSVANDPANRWTNKDYNTTCLKEHVSKIQPSMGSGWLDGTRKPNASFFKILPKQKKTYWLFEHKKP